MNDNYTNAKSLGERLYILREGKGLSQEELAEILNVSRQTISNWENDKVKLDVVKAKEICKLYEISLDELLTDKANKQENAPRLKQLRNIKFICLMIVLILSVLLIITAIVLLISRDNSSISSAIYISEATGWGIALACGVIGCIVTICFIFKIRKDK